MQNEDVKALSDRRERALTPRIAKEKTQDAKRGCQGLRATEGSEP